MTWLASAALEFGLLTKIASDHSISHSNDPVFLQMPIALLSSAMLASSEQTGDVIVECHLIKLHLN